LSRIRFLIFSLTFNFLSLLFLDGSHVMGAEIRGYTLEEIMSIAIEKNPSGAVFKANLEASKGEVISARAYPNPEFEFEGGRGKSLDTSDSKGEYSVGIGQPLEWPARRLYRKKAAEAGVEVVEKDIEDFRLELKAEVKKVFFRLLSDEKALEIARENLKIVEELLKTIELRVKAGEAPEFESVKGKVEALRAEKELKRANNRLAISMASLNALLGNSLKEDFDIEGEFKLTEKRYELPALLSSALEKHPLILRARKDAEAKGYVLEREKASVFPDVTVKGFYSREIDKELSGLGLSIPIPLWYQRRGEISTARADLARAQAEVFKTQVELSKAITEEYQNYIIARDQIDVFEKGLLKQADEALKIAEFSYRYGESGLLDYLDAQRVYRVTLTEYYQSFFELEASLAMLERVAGGLPLKED